MSKFSELPPAQQLAYRFSKRSGDNPPLVEPESTSAFTSLLKSHTKERLDLAIDFVFSDAFWVEPIQKAGIKSFQKNIQKILKDAGKEQRIKDVRGKPSETVPLPYFCPHDKYTLSINCPLCLRASGLVNASKDDRVTAYRAARRTYRQT